MKYKKSETSIATIITAAMRVLARQGYARTSLMDIAQEAGMSKGAVHYHFPTKEALIVKVLEHACNVVAERASGAWNQSSGSDPLTTMRSAVRELWRMRLARTEESSVIADLLAQSIHDESLRPKLADYYNFATTQLSDYLDANLPTLGLKTNAPTPLIARTLNGLLDGLVMQALVDPEAVTEEHVFRAVDSLAASFFAPA